jgi:hypothetical protein
MTPRVARAALAATLIGVALSHLEWSQADNGHLLVVDGRPIDVQGWMNNLLNRVRRDCTTVQALQATDTLLHAPLQVLREHSPPASRSARLAGAWASGGWMLLEVEFDALLPAVVLMHKTGADWTVAPQGVWSGQTQPWLAAPLIRAYLSRQVTSAPAPLLACFDPQSASLNPQQGGRR